MPSSLNTLLETRFYSKRQTRDLLRKRLLLNQLFKKKRNRYFFFLRATCVRKLRCIPLYNLKQYFKSIDNSISTYTLPVRALPGPRRDIQ